MRTASVSLNDDDYATSFYSEANMARLRHSFKQAEEGKVIRKTMEELEDMADSE